MTVTPPPPSGFITFDSTNLVVNFSSSDQADVGFYLIKITGSITNVNAAAGSVLSDYF
jgi:hypothetical protein